MSYLLIEDHFKAPLSVAIQTEYNKFIKVVAEVPLRMRSKKVLEGTGGKVSVADLIAYHIGWGTSLLGWYKAGLKGEVPEMPGAGFTTWDYVGLANHFYEEYHYDGGDQQAKKFYSVVQQIVKIVENEYQSGNLDKKGVWPWCTLA